MKFDQHGNGVGLDDLYVLPESADESAKIIKYLDKMGIGYHWSFANVKGHAWYGQRFIEVPFYEHLKDQLERLS